MTALRKSKDRSTIARVNAGNRLSSPPVVPAFTDEVVGDGIVVRAPTHEDVPHLAEAFVDPVLGGEAGLPH